ncbi:hypothetical protein RRG08_056452 [Elysia crispata]|uniref:Uncharacterized protein n=1 Tax=Elysia crispata TaxID=231223 RepID=A0AAE0ZCT3_9GAST|nr:hypothetical protein RRG08_056452 [Elysia crispata]
MRRSILCPPAVKKSWIMLLHAKFKPGCETEIGRQPITVSSVFYLDILTASFQHEVSTGDDENPICEVKPLEISGGSLHQTTARTPKAIGQCGPSNLAGRISTFIPNRNTTIVCATITSICSMCNRNNNSSNSTFRKQHFKSQREH